VLKSNPMNNLLGQVIYTRGGQPESWHEFHVAIVDTASQLRFFCGDANLISFPRSSSKPIQALPLAMAVPDLPSDELAIACASHAGTQKHVAVVQRLLARSGSDLSDLQSGAHPPFDPEAHAELIRLDQNPTALHHNCSGKHAGMLLACITLGWSRRGYTQPLHPLQVRIRELHAELAGLPLEAVQLGTDGCSLPTFALPLHGMARAAAQLATPNDTALERVFQAMRAQPFLVAGVDRLDSSLMPLVPGMASKMGAEGFYLMMLRETPFGPLGVAIKILDGAERARPYTALAVLEALGMPVTAEMRSLAPDVIRNAAGLEVGTVETRLRLQTP
jgi:L-asparaginase II